MHPRNRYFNNPPNFAQLGSEYPAFKKHVFLDSHGKAAINFKDPEALRELTYTLLHRDFGITLSIPLDSLCPAITVRLNYLHWIEDLLNQGLDPGSNSQQEEEEKVPKPPVNGIDIGTGHSCIYPLLGCKLNPSWSFIATDIDPKSLEFAKANVKENQLEERIECLLNPDKAELLFPVIESKIAIAQYDFCMCNPPFYESWEHVSKSKDLKEEGPRAVCQGTENEMLTQGGEVAFVKTLIQESKSLRERIRWYTTMLGFRGSLQPLVDELQNRKISRYTITEFRQGSTTRWGLAWTYTEFVAVTWPAESSTAGDKRKHASTSEFSLRVDDPLVVHGEIVAALEHFRFTFVSSKSGLRIAGYCLRNTWNRKARRELGNGAEAMVAAHKVLDPFVAPEVPSEAIFGFDLMVKKQTPLTAVTISWISPGGDSQLDINQSRVHFQQFFETFQNRVTERVEKRTEF